MIYDLDITLTHHLLLFVVTLFLYGVTYKLNEHEAVYTIRTINAFFGAVLTFYTFQIPYMIRYEDWFWFASFFSLFVFQDNIKQVLLFLGTTLGALIEAGTKLTRKWLGLEPSTVSK